MAFFAITNKLQQMDFLTGIIPNIMLKFKISTVDHHEPVSYGLVSINFLNILISNRNFENVEVYISKPRRPRKFLFVIKSKGYPIIKNIAQAKFANYY